MAQRAVQTPVPFWCAVNQAQFDGVRPPVTGNSEFVPDSAAARLRCLEYGGGECVEVPQLADRFVGRDLPAPPPDTAGRSCGRTGTGASVTRSPGSRRTETTTRPALASRGGLR